MMQSISSRHWWIKVQFWSLFTCLFPFNTLLNFTVFVVLFFFFQNVMAVEEPLKRAYQVCIFLLFIYVSTWWDLFLQLGVKSFQVFLMLKIGELCKEQWIM
jgi:hypothetical protein